MRAGGSTAQVTTLSDEAAGGLSGPALRYPSDGRADKNRFFQIISESSGPIFASECPARQWLLSRYYLMPNLSALFIFLTFQICLAKNSIPM